MKREPWRGELVSIEDDLIRVKSKGSAPCDRWEFSAKIAVRVGFDELLAKHARFQELHPEQ